MFSEITRLFTEALKPERLFIEITNISRCPASLFSWSKCTVSIEVNMATIKDNIESKNTKYTTSNYNPTN